MILYKVAISNNKNLANHFLEVLLPSFCTFHAPIIDTVKILTSDLKAQLVDKYPKVYMESRAHIAGLLVATEAKRLGIDIQSPKLEEIMLQYLSDDSTMLSDEGIQTLNFYSQQGYHLIREFPLEEKPTSREEFLEAFNIAMQLYEKQDSEVN